MFKKFKNLFKIKVDSLRDFCDIQNLDDLIKRGVKFPYPLGIVIHKDVKIGDNCVIYQNVTLGASGSKNPEKFGVPILKENVTIYANACVVGNVTIGENSIIGANSVVLNDVPPNCTIAGNPAKVIYGNI